MASKEHILETTCRLFMERGCKSVTMDDIASENGISKRTLYEQFADKSALLEACILYMGEKDNVRIEEIRKNSENVLEFLFAVHSYRSDSGMKIYANFFSELQKYYPEVYEGVVARMRSGIFRSNRELIVTGQRQGIFHDYMNVDILAALITRAMNMVKDSGISRDLDVTGKEVMQNMLFIFLRGMSTVNGIRIIDDFLKRKTSDK